MDESLVLSHQYESFSFEKKAIEAVQEALSKSNVFHEMNSSESFFTTIIAVLGTLKNEGKFLTETNQLLTYLPKLQNVLAINPTFGLDFWDWIISLKQKSNDKDFNDTHILEALEKDRPDFLKNINQNVTSNYDLLCAYRGYTVLQQCIERPPSLTKVSQLAPRDTTNLIDSIATDVDAFQGQDIDADEALNWNNKDSLLYIFIAQLDDQFETTIRNKKSKLDRDEAEGKNVSRLQQEVVGYETALDCIRYAVAFFNDNDIDQDALQNYLTTLNAYHSTDGIPDNVLYSQLVVSRPAFVPDSVSNEDFLKVVLGLRNVEKMFSMVLFNPLIQEYQADLHARADFENLSYKTKNRQGELQLKINFDEASLPQVETQSELHGQVPDEFLEQDFHERLNFVDVTLKSNLTVEEFNSVLAIFIQENSRFDIQEGSLNLPINPFFLASSHAEENSPKNIRIQQRILEQYAQNITYYFNSKTGSYHVAYIFPGNRIITTLASSSGLSRVQGEKIVATLIAATNRIDQLSFEKRYRENNDHRFKLLEELMVRTGETGSDRRTNNPVAVMTGAASVPSQIMERLYLSQQSIGVVDLQQNLTEYVAELDVILQQGEGAFRKTSRLDRKINTIFSEALKVFFEGNEPILVKLPFFVHLHSNDVNPLRRSILEFYLDSYLASNEINLQIPEGEDPRIVIRIEQAYRDFRFAKEAVLAYFDAITNMLVERENNEEEKRIVKDNCATEKERLKTLFEKDEKRFENETITSAKMLESLQNFSCSELTKVINEVLNPAIESHALHYHQPNSDIKITYDPKTAEAIDTATADTFGRGAGRIALDLAQLHIRIFGQLDMQEDNFVTFISDEKPTIDSEKFASRVAEMSADQVSVAAGCPAVPKGQISQAITHYIALMEAYNKALKEYKSK